MEAATRSPSCVSPLQQQLLSPLSPLSPALLLSPLSRHLPRLAAAKAAFIKHDLDKSGTIDKEELFAYLLSCDTCHVPGITTPAQVRLEL